MTALAVVESAPSTLTDERAGTWFSDRLATITIVGALWRIGYLRLEKIDGRVHLSNHELYYAFQASLNSEGHWFESGLGGLPGAEHCFLTSLYLMTLWRAQPV